MTDDLAEPPEGLPAPADGLAAIELVRVRVPLRLVLRAAHGTTPPERDVVLVRAIGDDGVEGWGECSALEAPTYTAEHTEAAWPVLRDRLAPDALAGGRAHLVDHRMASAGVEAARLDLALRRSGRSLAAALGVANDRPLAWTMVVGVQASVDELLAVVEAELPAVLLAGGRGPARPAPVTGAVPVIPGLPVAPLPPDRFMPPPAPGGPPGPDPGAGPAAARLAAAAARARAAAPAAGWGRAPTDPAVKFKIRPGWDLEPIRAVRACWPDLVLAVDANAAYTLDDVERLAAVVAEMGPGGYIEQPLAATALDDLARLADRLPPGTVTLDESISGPGDLARAAAAGVAARLNLKPARLGGVAATCDLARRAADVLPRSARFVGGLYETGVGRAVALAVACCPAVGATATDLGPSGHYYYEDITEPIEADGRGRMRAPAGLGIGVVPRPDRLAEVAVDRVLLRP